jgi:hypothetical protein
MLISISEKAAASDGGSLGFEGIDENGVVSWYMINRSITSRGTDHYNAVTCDNSVLNDANKKQLFSQMIAIRDTAEDKELRDFIDQFIK